MISLIQQVGKYGEKTAIVVGEKQYSYQELLAASSSFAGDLLADTDDLHEARVGYMVNPGFDYVKVQWGIWQAGGVAVPLCLTHPLPSLQYVIEDTNATIVVVSPEYAPILDELCREKSIRMIVLGTETIKENVVLPAIDITRRGLILYTSGTTNKPKGVVTTHKNLEAQVSTLIKAWEWTSSDHIICVLPLHHVHGIINVVSCSLLSGATCEFLPSFSAEGIFNLFLQGKLNVFMAVPTIYFKLIAFWEMQPKEKQEELTVCMKKFRLMVCGSAALPVTVMEKWEHISGQILLERYGMTEIGMAISNPYNGERRRGHVGIPLPGVNIRLVDEQNHDVAPDQPGEILINGDNVFLEYWNRPNATEESFADGRWFKSGDIAIVEDGYYRIMGRNSVDIIKSGGYKISALEIEEVLRTHNLIKDCAVVGIDDDEWGELIVAALVVSDDSIDLKELNKWLREKMAAYKTPRKYLLVKELPRNAMGKVTKNDVKKLFV